MWLLIICMYVCIYVLARKCIYRISFVDTIFSGCMTSQVAFEVNYQNAQGIAPVQTAVVVNPAYITKN